jgi:hypothetical protein
MDVGEQKLLSRSRSGRRGFGRLAILGLAIVAFLALFAVLVALLLDWRRTPLGAVWSGAAM